MQTVFDFVECWRDSIRKLLFRNRRHSRPCSWLTSGSAVQLMMEFSRFIERDLDARLTTWDLGSHAASIAESSGLATQVDVTRCGATRAISVRFVRRASGDITTTFATGSQNFATDLCRAIRRSSAQTYTGIVAWTDWDSASEPEFRIRATASARLATLARFSGSMPAIDSNLSLYMDCLRSVRFP